MVVVLLVSVVLVGTPQCPGSSLESQVAAPELNPNDSASSTSSFDNAVQTGGDSAQEQTPPDCRRRVPAENNFGNAAGHWQAKEKVVSFVVALPVV